MAPRAVIPKRDLKDMVDIRPEGVTLCLAHQTGPELEEAHLGRPFGNCGYLFELPDKLFYVPLPSENWGPEAIPVNRWCLPSPADLSEGSDECFHGERLFSSLSLHLYSSFFFFSNGCLSCLSISYPTAATNVVTCGLFIK